MTIDTKEWRYTHCRIIASCNEDPDTATDYVHRVDAMTFVQETVSEVLGELVEAMENDTFRKSEPADEYERGFDHGLWYTTKILKDTRDSLPPNED